MCRADDNYEKRQCRAVRCQMLGEKKEISQHQEQKPVFALYVQAPFLPQFPEVAIHPEIPQMEYSRSNPLFPPHGNTACNGLPGNPPCRGICKKRLATSVTPKWESAGMVYMNRALTYHLDEPRCRTNHTVNVVDGEVRHHWVHGLGTGLCAPRCTLQIVL